MSCIKIIFKKLVAIASFKQVKKPMQVFYLVLVLLELYFASAAYLDVCTSPREWPGSLYPFRFVVYSDSAKGDTVHS